MPAIRTYRSLLSAALGAAALLAGCASPGPPRPPSLQLPDSPADLTAIRRGDAVELTFTVPSRSTDGFALTAPIHVTVCRAVAFGPCNPVLTNIPLAADTAKPTATLRDILPPELLRPPAQLLRYQVTFFNSRNRTEGPSDPVFAASGASPAPVAQLTATSDPEGIALRWQPERGTPTGDVLLDRHGPPTRKAKPATSTPPAKPAHKMSRKNLPTIATPTAEAANTGDLLLRATPASAPLTADPGGSIDTSAIPGTPYTYAAYRTHTVTLAGHTLKLLSDPSPSVAVTLSDTFAPAPPTGLTAAAYTLDDANTAVDLIWQPNREPDLAGYLVFRLNITSGASSTLPPEQLTPTPISASAFHDRKLPLGIHARYTVIAIDTHGNRSAPSKPAEAP